MVINVGTRTDIVNCYTEWLFRRFREGLAHSRTPLFPDKVISYRLSPNEVDAVAFTSKNYAPALSRLHEIYSCYRTYFHYTITAYGKDLEPNIPDIPTSVDTLKALVRLVGKEKVAWRYTPILLSKTYTEERHFETFEYLCDRLARYIDRCIIGFIEMQPHLRTSMPKTVVLTAEIKRRIAEKLGKIACKYGIPVQICGNNADYSDYGVKTEGCLTLDILGKANGCIFKNMPHKGNRRGCSCIESRDLGWYDACPNLCKYCFSDKKRDDVAKNRALHDPASPLLIGTLKDTDELIQGVQHSFLRSGGNQMSLFDL